MSLPLKDIGSVKLSERDHSFLRAEALTMNIELTALVRNLVHEYVSKRIEVFRLADELHQAKGYGRVLEDNEG